MVLPVIILIIVSLIGALVFFYKDLENQCDLHCQLAERSRSEEAIFKIIDGSKESSSWTGGFADAELKHYCRDSIFVFCEADLLRLGDFKYDIKE